VNEVAPRNLVADALVPGAATHELVAPATGRAIGRVALAGPDDLARALDALTRPVAPAGRQEVFAFLARLRDELKRRRNPLVALTCAETGFVLADAAEIVDAAVAFLDEFVPRAGAGAPAAPVIRDPAAHGPGREMRILARPVRCVAAVVPQNASLTLGIVVLASALHAGARVILRPSLQCGISGALLAEAVYAADPPPGRVAVVSCLAKDFLSACTAGDAVDLIHYIGSNRHAAEVFSAAFASGKHCLLDGQGNGLLYVDETYQAEEAAAIITAAATRYNGETCTSVNGVLAAPAVYPALRDALVAAFEALRVGHPEEDGVAVGPLFSAAHARDLSAALTAGPDTAVLCGGEVRGAYLTPAVVARVAQTDALAREGLFGPALWVTPVPDGEVSAWIGANRFPLSDTILSRDPGRVRRFVREGRAARICVGSDPSLESMFEPWGGYPPSGLNPVSAWVDKYRPAFQLDGRLDAVSAALSDPWAWWGPEDL
jgi:acyl-CoA reductase-like NAD-dependent aldehyde dehydrogenase